MYSIGNELKDSFKPTSKWINNGIEWLTDVEEFYRERAVIEQEYASKLQMLVKKHFDKKAKASASLSVGDTPQITPGSLECASLVLWTDVLTQTEAIASEKVQLSKEFTTKVSDNISSLKGKSGRIAKKIESINEYLGVEKQKTSDDVARAKRHYDSLCQATENARTKTEKSASEKYTKKLAEKEVEMNIGKNEYLININVANRLKDKYYYQDVPECLDYFQELNESRVAILNKLLKNASIIERNSCDRVKEKLHAIDSTIEQNDPKLDTAMYIKHNMIDWAEPQDFYFVPCEFWHDDESLITKEPELTELKRMLNSVSGQYTRYEEACLNTKQQLEEATTERKRDSDSSTITLKFDAALYKSLLILEQFIMDDSKRVQSEVKIEVIQNFAGDKDLSYVEQEKKKKSRFGFLKSGGQHHETGNNNIVPVKSANTHTSLGGVFNLRKGKETKTGGNGGGNTNTAKALFEYVAAGNDEVSLSPGEALDVIEFDDGSGWTLVKSNDGQQGLVPTSYIEVAAPSTQAHAPIVANATGGSTKKGPSVAPKRGAKRVQYVEALYDYVADGDDEISISAGDRIVLIQDDTDGSGWTEGELGGVKGMFPTSYVKKV
ncbi:protein Bzz1p [[Candida] anglica]|uniref:Protein Bzz1p n=1 Tax=[Candida] anglica TaxID=148631 RepID=A0ABP0EHQ1_9ASCO